MVEQYSPEETEQRLRAMMRGAAHRPTPLKDIPTRRGKKRADSQSEPPPFTSSG